MRWMGRARWVMIAGVLAAAIAWAPSSASAELDPNNPFHHVVAHVVGIGSIGLAVGSVFLAVDAGSDGECRRHEQGLCVSTWEYDVPDSVFGVNSSTWAIVPLPVLLSLSAAGIALWIYSLVELYGSDAEAPDVAVWFDGSGVSGVF
jgi:hypothetical protein